MFAPRSFHVPCLLLAALSALFLGGCLAAPPAARTPTAWGDVRAESEGASRAVAALVAEHYPRVVALVPDTRERDVAVWVQPTPTLYRFWTSRQNDADGFWAERLGRIHLRADADNVERTLVHELVHAALGESWDRLPGTLEEGLCDLVSARLCPDGAARMRAGRLTSAAFATGGLALDLELAVPAATHPLGLSVVLHTRLFLEGERMEPFDPERVFEVNAGLSSTDVSSETKRAYYGLAFLVVERIVERSGIEGLHELCLRAAAEGHRRVPRAWLLAAAELDGDLAGWRAAVRDALGPAELAAMVRMHPEVLVGVVLHHAGEPGGVLRAFADPATVEARLAVAGGGAVVRLTDFDAVRRGLEERW